MRSPFKQFADQKVIGYQTGEYPATVWQVEIEYEDGSRAVRYQRVYNTEDNEARLSSLLLKECPRIDIPA